MRGEWKSVALVLVAFALPLIAVETVIVLTSWLVAYLCASAFAALAAAWAYHERTSFRRPWWSVLFLGGMVLVPPLCAAEVLQPWWHIPHRWLLGGADKATAVPSAVIEGTVYMLLAIREDRRRTRSSNDVPTSPLLGV